jgi:hypothetical protein
MGLDLYMVGLQCRDFEGSLEFYRRLGLAVPDIREGQTHIEMPMRNCVTLYINAEGRAGVVDTPHVVLEFYLKERPKVDAKHAEMTRRRPMANQASGSTTSTAGRCRTPADLSFGWEEPRLLPSLSLDLAPDVGVGGLWLLRGS